MDRTWKPGPKPRPEAERRCRRVQVRLLPAEEAQLRRVCARMAMSPNRVLIALIREAFERFEAEQPLPPEKE